MNQPATTTNGKIYLVFLILGIILFAMQIYLAYQQMREKRMLQKIYDQHE